MERREFLRSIGMGTAVVFIGSNAPFFLYSCGDEMMTGMQGGNVFVTEGDFSNLLPIPSATNGQATLIAQRTTHNIFRGKISRVLGYQSGSILGASIVVNSGDNINVNFRNNLSEASNIHWHGIITPANMDGHPEDIVFSGGSFIYNFIVTQRAGLYWYHPHPHGHTAKQAYLGLAGAFIVRDAEEQSLNLPSGEYEIPLVIQDKRIFPDYALDYSPTIGEIMTGYMGQYITVNGVNSPYKDVRNRNYRFRILNGSNGRIYNIALSNGSSFGVIGADGGLLTAPNTVTSLLLGPGERADLIVDFSSYSIGTELFLINKTFSAGAAQGMQEYKIIKFKVTQNDPDNFILPGNLSIINRIPESSATRTRVFDIANVAHGGHDGHGGGRMHTINNKTYEKTRVDETVQAGSTEIWVFDNSEGAEPHPMHIHAVQFQVLDRTGGRSNLIATESGWKDTIMLLPGEKVRVIMTFGQNRGKFVFHCHNLEHEDDGMMLQFEIV